MDVLGRQCANQHDLMVAVLLGAGGTDAEILRPKGESSRIADVWFNDEGWIFEVKSLETNRPSEPKVQRQVGQRLAEDSPKFGGPVPFGTVRVDITKLPEPTAWNIMRIIGRNVQAAVDEANRQIKQTKKFIAHPDPKGCVALICPPHELEYNVILQIVADALRGGRNSSINMALVAHSPLLAPFGARRGSSSVVFQGRDGVRPSESLRHQIGQAWAQAHSQPLINSLPPSRSGQQ